MIAPWLTTLPLPLPTKLRVLPVAVSPVSSVEATRPPTLTCAPWPNTTPFGLMRKTWPLASMRPRIRLPLVSAMRLTAMDVVEGWTKSTVSCLPTLKLAQPSDRLALDCLMVVTAPDCVIVPLPAVTCPPLGVALAIDASAARAVIDRAGRASRRRVLRPLLPRPRAVSATAIHPFATWLQTRR